MRIYILLFAILPFLTFSQSLYNPQELYDMPRGLFDEDSLRTIHLDFYNPNYHNYLVSRFSQQIEFLLIQMPC